MREFELPDVGEGVAEGEIVRWLVSVGDRVEEDQPVAEVETDKALVEVPSPVDGVVRELRAAEGEVVPVGDVIVVFEADEEAAVEAEETEETEATASAEDAHPEGTGVESERAETEEAEASAGAGRVFAPPRVRRLARELGVDLGDVDGSGPGGRVTEGDVRAASEAATAESTSQAATDDRVQSATDESAPAAERTDTTGGSEGERGAGGATVTDAADRDRTLAAPATRRVARELDVDIDRVPAVEEREGEAFVTEEAVRQFAADGAETEAAGAGPEPEAPAATEDEATTEAAVEHVPYRGVRRSIGEQMKQSADAIPHVTHHDTADANRLVEVREMLKPSAEERGIKLTYLPFVMKAVVAGLREFPELNAELDEEEGEVRHKKYYNIGVATATDVGLMVPVVDAAAEKGLLELASAVNEKTAKARDRSIAREEMQGGTFTITNFGTIGGEYATPIINHPEVGILGLGSIEKRPRVVDDEVVPRHTLPLSLSIDHRIVDGAVAAQFTNTVIEHLEEPARLLLE